MDLTSSSPREIDARNAELYEAHSTQTQRRASALQSIHYAVEGDPKVTYVGRKRVDTWRLSTEDVLKGEVKDAWDKASLVCNKGVYWAAVEALRVINAEIATLDAEFTRRGGWTRFFLVLGGHIHSSQNCSTCNKGKSFTQFGWLPQYSGKSEKEMIEGLRAEKGGSETIMCTVCYPSAPTEWTEKPVDNSICTGSKTYHYDRKTARLGFYSGNYGLCNDCGERVTVTSTGALRTHKTKVSV